MKIKQIELYKSPIRLKEPFIISLGRLDYASNILIRIATDEGLVGYGECSPFLTIHGESIETCFEIGKYLGKVLLGKNPQEIANCINEMDSILFGNNCIKSAFDMALYDLAAQVADQPLYAYLGGKRNKELITDYTVSIGDAEKMAADAKIIQQKGFQVIKVKLGGTKEQDVHRIQRIRDAVGCNIPIRIDANQGWEKDQALEILMALHPYRIQHCEEPIPRHYFMELSKLRMASPIPIMADESCCTYYDAERLIQLNACDLFNIKLSKSGGIFNALKIIALAEKASIDLQIGGFLESRLGFTAAAHLALTSERILYCDFDTPLMFEEDPINGGISYDSKGVIHLTETSGLGASPDLNYLHRLEKVVLK